MFSVYSPCPCGSDKKFKFCCYEVIKAANDTELAKLSLQWPLNGCFVAKNWQLGGKTMLFVIRNMPNELFFLACYLIDAWCLGIKDAYIRINLGTKDLRLAKDSLDAALLGGIDEISYEDARSIIFGSLKYAESLGFSPHPGWEDAQYAIEPERFFTDKFQFGYDGKPFYVEGPFDREDLNVKEIRTKVLALGGRWEINMETGFKGHHEK